MPVRAMFVSVRGVDPVVSALRETSIVFAVIISAVVLRERVRRQRWLAAGLIVVGVGGAVSRVIPGSVTCGRVGPQTTARNGSTFCNA